MLQKNGLVIHQVPKNTSPLIQVRTMNNLKMSLEPLQTHNLLYQYFHLTLVMKTVCTAMNIEHKVETPKRPLYYPDLYVLANDEHWTMTPETHKYAAAVRIILLCDYRRWRSRRRMQFDPHAVCATIFVPQWNDQRLRQHKN